MQALEDILDGIKPIENISITALSIEEFSNLGQLLGNDYEEEIAGIVSEDLHSVLKSTVDKGAQGKFHETLVEHLRTAIVPNDRLLF